MGCGFDDDDDDGVVYEVVWGSVVVGIEVVVCFEVFFVVRVL